MNAKCSQSWKSIGDAQFATQKSSAYSYRWPKWNKIVSRGMQFGGPAKENNEAMDGASKHVAAE